MFADNHKISGRQAFRLLTFDLLGCGTLLLPTALAKVAGRDGIFCIALGVGAAICYLWLLAPVVRDMENNEEFPQYLSRRFGKLCARACMAGYALYFVLLAGYVAWLFADVVQKSLLREESFSLVLIIALLLGAYGVWGGLEGRARVYELLFWFLLVPLLAMFAFAADEVQPDYWAPVFTQGVSRVALGGYCVFLCLAISTLILFLGGRVKHPGTLLAAGKGAVLCAGAIYAVLYLILSGIFGAAALGEMEFPAITMMSTVQAYGGFLKRTDALMFGIWFFTLYALLGGSVFYGGYSLAQFFGVGAGESARRRERYFALGTLPVVFALAMAFYRDGTALRWFEQFLWYVGTPFLVAVPLLIRLAMIAGGKKRVAAAALAFFLISGTACGCGTPELEERSFPAEIVVANRPDLSEAWLAAEFADCKRPDYNHLKMLFLERALLENEAGMEELLELLEQKMDVPRNAYVVAVEDAGEISSLTESLGESVGGYLEKQFETVSKVDSRSYPTLGMLYQERKNRQETLFLPLVETVEGRPAVESYCVWKRGRFAGEVADTAAMLAFFTQNRLDSYLLSVGGDAIVELKDAHNKVTLEEAGEERRIAVQVRCKGIVVSGAKNPGGKLEDAVEAYMNWTAGALMREQAVDLSNSYRKLGGAKREWYQEYQDAPEAYEPSMGMEYHVKIDWVEF